MPPRTADELRRAFQDFFAARGHAVVPSASLVPQDRSVLFTVAGMVPFKPYFLGAQRPPWPRAVSCQRCLRAGGKHNDLEEVGRTNRHMTFFEMLGNFSFGDYFKAEAIPWAWEFYTDVCALDPDRLWVTVHETDDEAEAIWRDRVGVPAARIQRLTDDNFWRMGDTGPCGPCSEIFFDLGPDHGPDGGPAHGGHERFIEIWNLVFMQYDAQPDGSLVPLPAPSVDTGAGLERNLAVLQGTDSVWETDVMRHLIAAAEAATGVTYQAGREPGDISLRILAEHGRAATFLVVDGVVPSNEERGYVLRRILRRAVRHAYLLGSTDPVTPPLVAATAEVMGEAYPEVREKADGVRTVLLREEERFRQTLARGLELLEGLLAAGDVDGERAFYLHDTLGFPVELTAEIAAERGRQVDLAGFAEHMARQRARARAAHRAGGGGAEEPVECYREILDETGETLFTGRQEVTTEGARIVALVRDGERIARASAGETVQVFCDRTPFYAEAGGQVGDTGTITTDTGRAEVLDTQYALPGTLVAHHARVTAGELTEGDVCTLAIDAARRDAIRRNHTATHLLHWALREVLGTHVQQAGSLVAPDRLRFDFTHPRALSQEELDAVEQLANREVLTDAPVRHYETTMDHARELGALAFFDERYGDLVRVLEAGEHSIELCGGTHVHALGFIGPIKIIGESSIGANLRRIEAVTGEAALARIHDEERQLRRLAAELGVGPGEVADRVEALLGQLKQANAELTRLRRARRAELAAELAAASSGGLVTARIDDLAPDELRDLALAVRDRLRSGIVVLAGEPTAGKASLVVAVSPDLVAEGLSAAEIGAPLAKRLGGGAARNPELVVGGGTRPEAIDEALAEAARVLQAARGSPSPTGG